jgi:phage terminase large subunit-like protein
MNWVRGHAPETWDMLQFGKHHPIEWAKIAIAAYRAHHADRIVAERNNGGVMVEATIRRVDNKRPGHDRLGEPRESRTRRTGLRAV